MTEQTKASLDVEQQEAEQAVETPHRIDIVMPCGCPAIAKWTDADFEADTLIKSNRRCARHRISWLYFLRAIHGPSGGKISDEHGMASIGESVGNLAVRDRIHQKHLRRLAAIVEVQRRIDEEAGLPLEQRAKGGELWIAAEGERGDLHLVINGQIADEELGCGDWCRRGRDRGWHIAWKPVAVRDLEAIRELGQLEIQSSFLKPGARILVDLEHHSEDGKPLVFGRGEVVAALSLVDEVGRPLELRFPRGRTVRVTDLPFSRRNDVDHLVRLALRTGGRGATRVH